ncbi:MAG: DNA-directed RNA polymerase subunit B', partial [Amphibacillus sp.]|nr:DNA-directed RNA polymerase subunit B' [Amphibacillus sp.]
MKNNLSLTWDLETIFEGGSESSELKQYIQAAQDWIETF